MAKGENIFKRKDGRWEGRYIKGHDNNNRIIYGFCYGHSYREAKEKVTAAKLQIQRNPRVVIDKKTEDVFLEQLCEKWLEINKNKLKESSWSKYESMIKNHIVPAFGKSLVKDITTEHIAMFTDNLLSEKCLAVKTVRDILLLLHSVLVYGYEKSEGQWILPRIIYPKQEPQTLRILSKTEQLRLMKYLEQDMDIYKLCVMIALTTGLRVGEICGLRWEDISFENQTLSVKTTVQRIKNHAEKESGKKTIVIIGTPKSRNSIRTIPLTQGVLKWCKQFQSDNEKAFLLTGTLSFVEPRILQRKLMGYYRQCGITNAHFHTLRHTFATRCIEVGFDIKTLSEILGHSSTVITMNRYVHPDMNLKRKNIKKLEMSEFGCVVR